MQDDCSAESKELDFDVSREDVLEYSAYAYFTLPYISQEVAQRNVELEVQADFHFKTYWMYVPRNHERTVELVESCE